MTSNRPADKTPSMCACMHVMRVCARIYVHELYCLLHKNGCEQVDKAIEKAEKLLSLTLTVTLTRWRKCYSRGTTLLPPPPPPP